MAASAETLLAEICGLLAGELIATPLGTVAIETAALDPDDFTFAMMRLNGGEGSFDMNVDGSAANQVFEWRVPLNRVFKTERLNLHIQDGSIRADGFGGLGPLANGVLIQAIGRDGTTELKDFTGAHPIVRHKQMGLLAGVDATDTTGVGGAEDATLIRWTLAKAGAPFRLREYERLRLTIRDDLSDITIFQGMLQGVYES